APTDATANDISPEFDREAIDHLIEALTETTVKELLVEFVDGVRAKIERMPELLAKVETLTIEVHSIKSSARQVGAVALSRHAAELERKAVAREAISEDEIGDLARHLSAYTTVLVEQNLMAA